MSKQLIPFQFENFSIRVVIINGVSYFGARDVAVALGYADPSYAYQTHCKHLKLLNSEESSELNWVNPHPRGEYVMPESDVYRLIMRSNKPEAERFEAWVFEDVLPTIRQTGGYGAALNAPKPRPSVAVLADSPYPRLHDQLNKALTLLTRPTSQMIKQVAFQQAQQLCEQLGIAALEGETLPDFTARAHTHKKPSSVDDQVMLYLERRKQHGAGKRDLSRECYAFCKLHKLDQDALLQRLLDQGRVVMVTRHRAPIFVATPFAEMAA